MKKILLAAFLVIPWFVGGCVESHGNMGPASTFEKAYTLALTGKYDQTSEYFTDDILNFLKTNQDMTIQKVWNGRLNDGAVKAIKIIERQTDEKKCDIKFMIVLNDGTMTDAEETMVFEKGLWKFDKIKRIR
jgi:hypothetical protein